MASNVNQGGPELAESPLVRVPQTPHHSADTDALWPALLKAVPHFEPLKKTKAAHQYRYADLADLMDIVRQPLADAGLFVVHFIGDAKTETRVIHAESGQWMGSSMPLELDAADQAIGSSLTYRRRYCLLGLLGLAPEDDDGAAAQAARQPTQRKAPSKPSAPPQKPAQRAEDAPRATTPGPRVFWSSVREIMDAGGFRDRKGQDEKVREMMGSDGFESTTDMTQPQRNKLLAELSKLYPPVKAEPPKGTTLEPGEEPPF